MNSPHRSMLLAVVFLFACSLLVNAQVAPARIKVTKKQQYQQERSEEIWVDSFTGDQMGTASATTSYKRNGVVCLIEVFNDSMKRLTNLRVKWAVFAKRSDQSLFVREGEKKCDIEINKKLSLKTDVLASPTINLKDVGYLVEVFSGDDVIATAMDPSTAKESIEKWRSERTKTRR